MNIENRNPTAARPTPTARRKEVARLVAEGKMTNEIAAALGVREEIVRRDINALREAAARRRPWGDPAACTAAFIEAAEDALQKVRTAQLKDKISDTTYHNLVKLEWQMLVKFIEMTSRSTTTRKEAIDDEEDESYSRYTNAELIQKARELGIDVTGFERALLSDEEDLDEAA